MSTPSLPHTKEMWILNNIVSFQNSKIICEALLLNFIAYFHQHCQKDGKG